MSGASLWIYLSASPLLWLVVTLGAWLLADAVAGRSGRHPLVNPVLLAITLVAALLGLTGTDYRTYFDGAQFVHFLLGPATVALGVPLYRNRRLVRANLVPTAVALLVGSATAIVSAVSVAWAAGVPSQILVSLAPKSVTAGVAMAISDQMGGIPSLTAALVIGSGIIGAIVVTPVMDRLGIVDYAARGFAVGLASHGIGTARAFSVSSVAGVFAGIAMGLNALITPLLLPPLLRLMGIS